MKSDDKTHVRPGYGEGCKKHDKTKRNRVQRGVSKKVIKQGLDQADTLENCREEDAIDEISNAGN